MTFFLYVSSCDFKSCAHKGEMIFSTATEIHHEYTDIATAYQTEWQALCLEQKCFWKF